MEIYLILIFMIFAAVVAVEMKDLISSVIALSAVGLGLCLGFLLLKAPTLAMTQLVVEILCVIILIRGTINRDLPLVRDGRWVFNTSVTLVFVASFLAFIYSAVKILPEFGRPLMRLSQRYLEDGMPLSGAANLVTAVTLKFRSYDALLEAAVLFCAVIGVLVITGKAGKSHAK